MMMGRCVVTLGVCRPSTVTRLKWPTRPVPRRAAESRGLGVLQRTAAGDSWKEPVRKAPHLVQPRVEALSCSLCWFFWWRP